MESNFKDREISKMTPKFRMTIDGLGCKSRYLGGCNDFLTVLAQTLNISERQRQLTGHSSPIGQQCEEIDGHTTGNKKPGIAAQMIFLESGLQLHTWPEVKEACLDIFSCKCFDRKLVEKAFKTFFNPKEIDIGYRSTDESW